MAGNIKINTVAIICIAVFPLLQSCLGESVPECSVSIDVDKESYDAGESVTFKIEGKTDQIVFFSGESGHCYDNSTYHFEDNDFNVGFVSYHDGVSPVHNNCQFLVSYDFAGNYSPEGLAAATWTDCSDDFGFTVTGANTESNTLNLKDILPDSRSIENPTYYLAFRYFDIDPEHPVSNRWCIRSINVARVLPNGEEEVMGQVRTCGWVEVVVGGCSMWDIGSVQLLAKGTTSSIHQTQGKDVWVVTKAFSPNKMAPDSGEIIKTINTGINTYTYTYSAPGTYEAVFYCSSVRYNGKSDKVIRKTIIVK